MDKKLEEYLNQKLYELDVAMEYGFPIATEKLLEVYLSGCYAQAEADRGAIRKLGEKEFNQGNIILTSTIILAALKDAEIKG